MPATVYYSLKSLKTMFSNNTYKWQCSGLKPLPSLLTQGPGLCNCHVMWYRGEAGEKEGQKPE